VQKKIKYDYPSNNRFSNKKDGQCAGGGLSQNDTVNSSTKAVSHLKGLESSITRGSNVRRF